MTLRLEGFTTQTDESDLTDRELRESNQWYRTSHDCACCQEYLTYTDEIYLLEVVEAAHHDGGIYVEPIVSETGDYAFDPLLLHIECWEEVKEQIRISREDEPPVECANGIFFCTSCESTIGAAEPFVSTTFGEIRISQRRPNGGSAEKVDKMGPSDPVCMACMVRVIEDFLDNWEDLLEALDINYGIADDEEGTFQ